LKAIVSRHIQRKPKQALLLLLGVDLPDAREELFVRFVCDGLTLGVAYARAGFTSKAHDAATDLFALPRIQERAQAILDARRTQGAVTLGEVTDMLKRVFAGAHAAEEYSAAHNAAFSLARLYGHVTDRATLEVIRRPSRDPDAPSEQALSSWVEALPALAGPGPAALGTPTFERLETAAEGPQSRAPALPLGQGPEPQAQNPSNLNDLQAMSRGPGLEAPGPEPLEWEKLSVIKGLDGVAGRTENGAPSGPVTMTPNGRAQSELLVTGGPGYQEKGAPVEERQVPGTTGGKGPEWPSAEELFG
jgi:hypothetical protein